MTVFEWLNPWRTVTILKERYRCACESLERVRCVSLIHQNTAMNYHRSLVGANKGSKRLHDKNVILRREIVMLKHEVRILKQKVGDE